MRITPKLKAWRSKDYRAFVRKHPCSVHSCSTGQRIECHHEPLGEAGMAVKAPDSHGLPLCIRHHQQRGNEGPETFWKGYNVEKMIIKLLTDYMRSKGL